MTYEGSFVPNCAICAQPVSLEVSKTDEHGQAVHENCYVWTVELKKPRRRISPTTERSSLTVAQAS
jgi:hypothetical protein